MVELKDRCILIDGKPQIIMSGEIHYFRLQRDEWQDRINKLKQAGCNAVSSYIPWLCHEPVDGMIDFDGRTLPQLDIGGFIDLCRENDLYFIARPGPFVMAELKNEGIPFWVYQKHPEIIPTSWDNKVVPTKTVDYLAPAFLDEVKKWYGAIMGQVISPRLQSNGGNIIAVQLDNEIGMLSWVSNSPDLTDNVVIDFSRWLRMTYESKVLSSRYPFDIDNVAECAKRFRTPDESYGPQFLHDLGYYMRDRFARYVSELRSYAEEYGISGVPFVINIHGTGGGRGFGFPIGISQLYRSYTQSPNYLPGSDIYIGDLTMNNFQDLYIINSYMTAVNTADQPITSMEFEAGDGNYGDTYGGRYDPSSIDLKTRMCIAQGNRLLNYYLFAGGINYVLEPKPDDGNNRIAITGERHGFAAPISPEGKLNYTYPRTARIIKTMMALSEKLSTMKEEHDNLALAFIPDYFMTEYCHPTNRRMREIVENLTHHRAYESWEILVRALLLLNYRFGAIDIQGSDIDPSTTNALIVPSALYMDKQIQEKLVDYAKKGGRLLIYGQVPQFDMEGNDCTILSEALAIQSSAIRESDHNFYLSVYTDGWAKMNHSEVRCSSAQYFNLKHGIPILRISTTDEVCGFSTRIGNGEAVVIATPYVTRLEFFERVLEKLEIHSSLKHDYAHHGIFMTTTSNENGDRFLHLINLDSIDKAFHIYENGRPLFEGNEILLHSRDGLMLPLNVSFENVRVLYSTTEITRISKDTISFRSNKPGDIIVLETNRKILPSNDYVIERKEEKIQVIRSKMQFTGGEIKIELE
ncbi:MAG TPA: beta-galactosidase [Fervidobacterium sp.]|nr:beta-galactosidase [Fervidobacterium sp.]